MAPMISSGADVAASNDPLFRPCRSTSIRSDTARRSARLWLMITTPRPISRSRSTSISTSAVCTTDSAAVGSSSTRIRGRVVSVRAIATAWRCPPDSSRTGVRTDGTVIVRSRRICADASSMPSMSIGLRFEARSSRPRKMFAATLRFSQSARSWNTVEMPRACAPAGLGMLTGSPSISTVPESGWSTPEMILASVDFPAPLSPPSATTSCACTVRPATVRASTAAQRLLTTRSASRGGAPGLARPCCCVVGHSTSSATVSVSVRPGVCGEGGAGVFQREQHRAHDLGVRAELRGDHLERRDVVERHPAADRLAHRADEQLAGLGELAADHDALRVHGDRQARDHRADGGAGVLDDLAAAGVAVVGEGDDVPEREASAQADLALGVDLDVADLARRAGEAAVQVLVQGDAGAGAVGRADVDGVLEVPAGAEAALGEGAEVGVVVDEHRDAQALRHDLGDGGVVPAAEDAGDGDGAGRGVHRGGEADADAEELVEAGADALEDLDDEEGGAVEAGVGAVLVGEGEGLLDEDLGGRVGEGDAHVPGADVHARGEAGEA